MDENRWRLQGQIRETEIEIVEIDLLEKPESAEKYASHIDPYNPFSSHKRFFLNDKEVSKEEFFAKLSEFREIH